MERQFGFLREVTGSFDASQESIDSLNSVANQDLSANSTSSRLKVEGAANSTKIHKYPLFLDRGKQTSKIQETARECIRFTAVKQGGASVKRGDFEQHKKAALQVGIENADGEISKVNTKLEEGRNAFNVLAAKGEAPVAALQRLNSQVAKIDKLTGTRTRLEQGDIGALSGQDIVQGGLVDFLSTQATRTRAKPENIEHCFLYMPTSVVYNESATWGQESLGAMGNAAKQLIRGNGDVSNILKDFGAGIVTPLANVAAIGAGGAIAGIFGAVATAVGGQGVSSGIGQGLRVATNPYEEQLFTGVPFRAFNFTFDFIATSYTEWQEVQKIIKMFRAHSRPTFTIDSDVDGSQNEALYSYPNEFAIDFLHLGEDDVYNTNPNLPKLHNCVLTNMTTNFAPDGWIAHEDGEPLSIVVQLAFTETRKNTRIDIEGGF